MKLSELIKIIAFIMLYKLAKEEKLDYEKLKNSLNEPNETFKEIVKQFDEKENLNKEYWKQIKEWRNKK